MPRRSSYGLQIDSDLDLPGLDAGDPSRPADVRVRRVDELPPAPPDTRLGEHLWLSPTHLRMTVPDVATFDVADGTRIDVVVAEGADLRGVRHYLLGTAMGTLLRQRGLLVLHGNAIRLDDDTCVVAVGHSGAGKSTLAAAFLAAGHDVLADDVVAVEGGRARPGLRRVKLWQDAVDRIGVPAAELDPLPGQPGKFEWLFDRPALAPLRIACVYVLEARGGVDRVQLEAVTGMARFAPLSTHTYRPELVRTDAELARELTACGDLAGRSRVVRVRRPADVLSVDDTVRGILDDVSG